MPDRIVKAGSLWGGGRGVNPDYCDSVGDLFPSAFEFFIGGHLGRSYGLERFADALYYTRRWGGSHPDEEATLRPDPERWERFWADMKAIGV